MGSVPAPVAATKLTPAGPFGELFLGDCLAQSLEATASLVRLRAPAFPLPLARPSFSRRSGGAGMGGVMGSEPIDCKQRRNRRVQRGLGGHYLLRLNVLVYVRATPGLPNPVTTESTMRASPADKCPLLEQLRTLVGICAEWIGR
jgi:hypothetical protein